MSAEDEVAALRESDVRLQQQLTEQRRRESRALLRATSCEQEKRKLEESIAKLTEAITKGGTPKGPPGGKPVSEFKALQN